MRAYCWPGPIILFLFCLGPFVSGSLFGATNPSEFVEANHFYEQGNYREARSHYQNILKNGLASAAVLFNLGNACFKNGEIGQAIYNYRRAQKLAPRDADIQANLRFARESIAGSASVPPPPWERAVRYFTPNELSIVAALALWALLILLVIIRWRPPSRTLLRPYLSIATTVLVLSALFLALSLAPERVAITLRSQTPIHLGPVPESQAAFTVPDGTELRIENRRDNWLQVIDRSNRSGWVEQSVVGILPKD